MAFNLIYDQNLELRNSRAFLFAHPRTFMTILERKHKTNSNYCEIEFRIYFYNNLIMGKNKAKKGIAIKKREKKLMEPSFETSIYTIRLDAKKTKFSFLLITFSFFFTIQFF